MATTDGDKIDADKTELKLVQTFFRHGARTPMNIIPNVESATWDKEKLFDGAEHTYVDFELKHIEGGPQPKWTAEERYRKRILVGGSYPGQMTTLGMEQVYKFGEDIRKHYIDKLGFLSSDFNEKDIYFRSTNIARTITSMRCAIAGLYGESIRKKKVSATVHVEAEMNEILYPNNRNCATLGDKVKWLSNNIYVIPGIKEDQQKLQQLLKSTHSDEEEEVKVDFIHIRDDLYARLAHGYEVPAKLAPHAKMIEQRALDITRYQIMGHSESERKPRLQLSVGPLLQMITDNFRHSLDGESSHKMHMYACHDSSVISLITALDIFDGVWPPYATGITFELYTDSQGKAFIRTLYLGKERPVLGYQKEMIPFEAFVERTSDVAVSVDTHSLMCVLPGPAANDDFLPGIGV